MGRGKSKAKQTKVARSLKYGIIKNDLSKLEITLNEGLEKDLFQAEKLEEHDIKEPKD